MNDFLDSSERKKIGKLDFIKIKNFCAPKDALNRVQKKYMEKEKIFVNHLSDEG
jgi:hypothetical protein